MLIGYARVSTEDQNVSLQMDALKNAQCAKIYVDHGWSGRSNERPALNEMLAALRKGDQLVVWKLDRLSRSLFDLLAFVKTLEKQEVDLMSISEAIDTRSPGGILVFHIMGAMAEFERALISERTKAGMHVARKNGIRIGRPSLLSPEQARLATDLVKGGEKITAIARRLDVSRGTIYRAVQKPLQPAE